MAANVNQNNEVQAGLLRRAKVRWFLREWFREISGPATGRAPWSVQARWRKHPPARLAFQRGMIQLLDLPPPFSLHRLSLPPSLPAYKPQTQERGLRYPCFRHRPASIAPLARYLL